MGGANSVELNNKIENSSEDTIVVSKLEARALLEEIQLLQSKCGRDSKSSCSASNNVKRS